MRFVIGISYREVPGGCLEASGSKSSTIPILTVNRTSPEIYYDYVYDVYDITSRKYIEEAVCTNGTPENIISRLLAKYQNDVLKVAIIPPKTEFLNPNLNGEQFEKVVKCFEEPLRFIFNLPHSVSSDDPILRNSKIVVFTVVEKTGVAWLYNCKETDDPFVYCKREKDFQLNDIDDSFIDKVFNVFNIQMNDCHVVYNSLEEDSFWHALEAKKEMFKSLQKTQVLTLLGDNRHYRATMCARYLVKDPNVKSFIIDKTSSFMDKVGSVKYIENELNLPSDLNSFYNDIMGIDLGTTRCVLSITSGKTSPTDVIPIDKSSDLCMPSAISFVQKPPIVGKTAMRQLNIQPKSVIFDAKRAVLPTMPHIQNTSPYVKIDKIWPFGVCKSHEEISFTVEDGEFAKSTDQQPELHNFSLEDITLILLQSIKGASDQTRQDAVITVPYQLEQFREFRLMKQDIEKAAEKSNVKLLGIIRETDANLLYYASRHALKENMNVLVVDIGGGTGILMIYKIGQKVAKNVGGRRECFYGRMIDQLLFEKLQDIMKTEYGIDGDKIIKKQFQLLNACQNIKHNLSTAEETELDLSEFDSKVERFHKITREWFENNIMEKVALNPDNIFISGISEFQVKLEGCKSYCNIDYVFLAGGTCRIPYVQNTIRKVFSDLDSSRIVIDPELEIITAQGALIHGCLVKRKLERPITSIFDRYLHDESDKKGARKEPLSLPQRHNDAPKSDFVPRLPICSACPARAKDIDAPKFEFELLRGCHSTGRRRQFACSEAGARAKEKPLSLPQRHDDDPKSKFVLPVFPEKYSLFSQALRKDQTKENYFISLHLCDPNFDCTYPKTNDNTPDEETDSDEEWDEEWDAVWD